VGDLLELHGFATAAGLIATDDASKGLLGSQYNFDRLTDFGLNITANLSSQWSVFAQVTGAGGRGDRVEFNLQADWVLLNYRPIDSVTIRGGRQVLPIWLLSDQIDVGYNFLWVHPPSEVYGLIPVKAISGASASYTLKLWGYDVAAEVYGGRANSDMFSTQQFPFSGPKIEQLGLYDLADGLNLTVQDDHLMVRGGITMVKVQNTTITSLVTTGAGGVPVTASVVTPLNIGDTVFASLGASLDYHNVIALAEYAHISAGGDLQNLDSVYGTLGYRIGRFLPRFTASWMGNGKGLLAQNSTRTINAGVNYRVIDPVVLKLEFENMKTFFPALGVTGPVPDQNTLNMALSAVF
jgi:hypothetical protein